ncbi:hypothetical protein WAF17_00745 [Bernardetia sp. ABR2-2B]|uniref:hypothetical protein n=1 Tax=Bernardetia sp. ABR2-2B TaxID=3127472 RepID=UPI0030D5C9F3
MKNTLTLTENQTHFLEENRQDPITGDSFSLGDEIVFCASCKSAFLKESWEYMGSKHCNQREILKSFPKSTLLNIAKPSLHSFRIPTLNERLTSFFGDIFFTMLIFQFSILFFVQFDKKLGLNGSSEIICYGLVFFYLIFRDSVLIHRSLGKRLNGLYFMRHKTKKRISFLLVLLRNILVWIINFIIIILFFVLYLLLFGKVLTDSLNILILLFIIAYVSQLIISNRFMIDRLLNIELVQDDNKKLFKPSQIYPHFLD